MTEETKLITRLVDTAVATPWFLDALTVVRGLDLPPWCIGAGRCSQLDLGFTPYVFSAGLSSRRHRCCVL